MEFYIRGISAYNDQPIVSNIIPDGIGETDGLTIIDRINVNTSSLELIDECLVVKGTHTGPASVADLTIEYCY